MNQRTFTPLQMTLLILSIVFFSVVLTIAYTGNGPTCFAFLKYIPGEDKTGHVVLLCALSLSISWALSLRGIHLRKVKFHAGILAVLAFITIEEFLQILSPNRTFDFLDLASNYVGILIAWLVLSLYERKHSQRVDPTGSGG